MTDQPSKRRASRSARPAGAARRRAKDAARPSPQRLNLTPYADAPDLVATVSEFERLRTFAAALHTAGLERLLSERGPFTIFAPTNRAFEKLPRREFDALLADASRLARVLCHHVVPGRVRAPRPDAPGLAMPIDGAELRLSATGSRYQVDGASIVKTNIRASNGVIHAIDTVLLAG
jgi:uncharacterized surface protein with fasciclin (FAS1) repeats